MYKMNEFHLYNLNQCVRIEVIIIKMRGLSIKL